MTPAALADRVSEARLLVRHLSFWGRVLGEFARAAVPRMHVTVFDDPVFRDRLADTVRPALSEGPVPLHDEPERQRGRGYYAGGAVRLTLRDGTLEVGDGGFTDWTTRLTSDAKERCVVSCLATERLVGAIDR